eukprot:GEMP01087920.1.p1 GENE.GEMP01087920.1~~GEMP01087920.1.p1  ORF type:complete len:125 (+),score=21.43 GEMP01087920.1:61-435(+)
MLFSMIAFLASFSAYSRHFDYIEVGTADFDAMADLMKRTNITGISVEMLKHLLDKVHSSPTKLHLNAAVSNVDGEMLTAYVVKEELLKPNCTNEQPMCLPWWFRGCSSIGKPHEALEANLRIWG